MPKIKSILFVCTGNSCRSVMAEGLLKKYLKQQGREDIEVKSAGINAVNNMAPTPETVEVMRDDSIDVSHFKSQYLTDELIKKSDLILVMAAHHMDVIIRRVPEAAGKTHLLKQFGQDSETKACEDLDIIDPIGKLAHTYEEVFASIKEEIERIVKLI